MLFIYYKKHIEAFSEAKVREFMHLMKDVEVNNELMKSIPEQRTKHWLNT